MVLDEPPGQIKHQLEYTTPIHPDMAGEFIKKMIEADLGKLNLKELRLLRSQEVRQMRPHMEGLIRHMVNKMCCLI